MLSPDKLHKTMSVMGGPANFERAASLDPKGQNIPTSMQQIDLVEGLAQAKGVKAKNVGPKEAGKDKAVTFAGGGHAGHLPG